MWVIRALCFTPCWLGVVLVFSLISLMIGVMSVSFYRNITYIMFLCFNQLSQMIIVTLSILSLLDLN